MSLNRGNTDPSESLLGWGRGLSVSYFFVYGAFWLGLDLKLPTSLNELGDTLSGLFAPLAFAWLVIGFHLQRIELRQSTEALELQAQELKNSVEQQSSLVAVSQEQLEVEKDFRQKEYHEKFQSTLPRFIVTRGPVTSSGASTKIALEITNNGADTGETSAICQHVESELKDSIEPKTVSENTFPVFCKDQKRTVHIEIVRGQNVFDLYILNLYFSAPDGTNMMQRFQVILDSRNGRPGVKVKQMGNAYPLKTVLDNAL